MGQAIPDISIVTPLICKLMNLTTPVHCDSLSQFTQIQDLVDKKIDIQKVLIFAPDAIGENVHQKFPELMAPLFLEKFNQITLKSVFPPKTPVCFASMFSGAAPVQHGIIKYEKPVLAIETMFDVMLAAGKKVAIVAVANSSVDLIFRNRAIDYFSEKYDQEVFARAIELLENNQHDVIVVYQQEYDDLLHQTGPYSKQSQEAIKRHVQTFLQLDQKLDLFWAQYNFMLMFTPDHGGHVDLTNPQKGDHGADIPEDMNLFHYYRLHQKI
jgi:hypothetical protein